MAQAVAAAPIIEIEVVKKAAPGGGAGVQSQTAAETETDIGDQHGVLRAAYTWGVLRQQPHGLNGGI